MGSVGGNSTENIQSFLDRAVGENDIVRIEANDMESLVGTKSQIMQSTRFKTFSDMYFGRFNIKNGEVIITAVSNADTAEKMKRRR